MGVALRAERPFLQVARRVIEQAGRGADYALIRLDRSATPRFSPAPMRLDDVPMTQGEAVSVIGCGSGVPQKIDSGGAVRNPRADVRDFFVVNTDTFVSNSGSGVYANGTLVGILVRGDADYVMRDDC